MNKVPMTVRGHGLLQDELKRMSRDELERELKKRLDTSDGNLSVHARKLEEAGYVEILKSFEGRMPRTDYRLTDAGREALQRYLDHMEALIERVRE